MLLDPLTCEELECFRSSPLPGLDLVLSAYRDLLPQLGSGITSDEGIHFARLQTLLARLARDEERAYERRAVSHANDLSF
jgi:5'-3' exonuclease